MQIAVYFRPSADTGTIQAYCPDLPGCSSIAPTERQALETLRKRVAAQLSSSLRRAPVGVRVSVIDI
jgi:hypothetical protein